LNIIDQFYAVLVYVWSEVHTKAPIMGFLIASTVATLRSISDRNFKLTEVLLCGVLAAIGCTSGEFLSSIVMGITGLVVNPDVVGGFVAGVIGYAGSKNTMTFIRNKFVKEDTKEVDRDTN
jgi:hypothetical protein